MLNVWRRPDARRRLDKPLVIIRDVTGSAAPALSSTVTANGKPFKVVMQLTSRD